MSKFDLSKFLVENKLTQLGRLTERPMDSQESFLDSLHNNVKSQLATPEEHARLENYLDTEGYEVWDEFGGLPDGLEQATNAVLSKITMQEASLSEEELAQQAIAEKEDIVEPAAEVDEDFSKYGSVEDLMKEIERSTNEAALKHKMDRVKKAYESIESKAASLEEGDAAQYLALGKIKEMRRSSKELRKMHEKLLKEYEKRYPVKKKSELNEGSEDGFELTADDVVALVGDNPLKVYKKGGLMRVHDYSNAQEFLKFFHKYEPNVVYKQERPGMFAAMDKPMEPGKGYTPPATPAKADYTSYYAKKGSGGFTGD